MEKKRLKIAIFIDVFYPMVDGVVVVVDNYARRLSEFADVTVFCPTVKGKGYEDNFPYRVVRCKSVKLAGFDYPIAVPIFDGKFKREIREGQFDIVHIHSPFFVARLGVKYAKSHKIPLVATLHSQYKTDLKKAVRWEWFAGILLKYTMRPFNACDECWTVNSAIQKLYTGEYGLKPQCSVIHNATDMSFVDPAAAAERVNSLYGIAPDERVLLFSGRINNIKNIFLIADSLAHVKEAGIKFRMLFVGSGQDEKKLQARIEKNGLAEDVLLVGRVTDRELLACIYNRADLFLFPSLYDANSLVQIEAASQKTPTIFVRGSATSSTATEGVNALMSENDPKDFADKIILALSDENLLRTLSENAYRDLYRTWDDVVEEVYNGYLRLIENADNAR